MWKVRFMAEECKFKVVLESEHRHKSHKCRIFSLQHRITLYPFLNFIREFEKRRFQWPQGFSWHQCRFLYLCWTNHLFVTLRTKQELRIFLSYDRVIYLIGILLNHVITIFLSRKDIIHRNVSTVLPLLYTTLCFLILNFFFLVEFEVGFVAKRDIISPSPFIHYFLHR